MDENWYSVEQEIRDRLTDARKAARVRTLVLELGTPLPRRNSAAATLRRWATWIVGGSASHDEGGAMNSTASRLEKGPAS
jgi:hypothetical protein